MGQKIIVGPINKGLRTDRTAFVIDNDSFPTLINAYQWRGRVKRKRGTSSLGRLKRFFNSNSVSYSSTATITLDGGGNGNLLTGFGLQTNGNIVPGSITLVGSAGPVTYTDPTMDGYLTPTGTGGPNTINYATGAILIPAQAGATITAIFFYYPDLPVLGIEDLQLISTQFPGTLAFDQTYSYNVLTANPYPNYDVSFYKNPPSSGSYTQKTNATPTTWNGQDYQQFWTTNYQGALWATNGINIPFSITNIGMQFQTVTAPSIVAAPTTVVIFTLGANPLVIGDFVFANEFTASTAANAQTLNFQTGYVTATGVGNVTVTFPNALIAADTYSGGILQFLTNRSSATKDCLRWYDGDPTNGSITNPVLTPGNGWVNFAPPLSQSVFSIADLPQAQYYLVGCRMILPFKDRLMFLGAVVANSGGGIFYLQDTVIFSQNGTPYYTCSFVGSPTSATTVFNALLVPTNQTATAPAYFEDSTGFGGSVSAGIAQPITTASANEDALIIGLSTIKTRFVYTGNELIPFQFFVINSELGDASTFSAINMDQGVITRGTRGYIITAQTQAQRIDLEIPDQVFEINLTSNGNERFCATRDFINEWIYFTYPSKQSTNKFPNQTLLYNYRDTSWAIFNESYTTYGSFRRQTGFTWQTVGMFYGSWEVWNDPWNAGESNLLQQEVLAGNQQGFLIIRDEGTGESISLFITSFAGSPVTVTSPNHNLTSGDYIIINNCIGSIGTLVNGEIFSVQVIDANTFNLNPDITIGASTYVGGGTITKMYVPQIQTRQFPVAWEMARKTRLGPQQYLFSTTNNAQVTLLIFLSQNSSSAYNDSPIIPSPSSLNNSLVYSTILYTCPESGNLGLTPPNVSLQMISDPVSGSSPQAQIWHRMNTSLIGDTVQIGITLSDTQMRALEVSGASFPITGATRANPCVLTCAGQFETGQLIKILNVNGMTQLNGNIYQVIVSSATTVTINVDSTIFGVFTASPNATATPVAAVNGFAEIELHSFILDVNPSQMLA